MTYTKPTLPARARWEAQAALDELLGVVPAGHAAERVADYAAYDADYVYDHH